MNRTVLLAVLRITFFGFSALVILCALSSTVQAASAPNGRPAAIDPSANYLFFHHNYYVESKGPDADCKYRDILKSFADQGFTVISEVRAKDTSVIEYANKAAAEVRELLAAGVPEERITVAGHSKGAVIALRVASLLEKSQVKYVVMAGCGIKGLENGYPDFSRLKGNFLSVYASSDKIAGSCSTPFSQAKENFTAKEVVLESAAGHQLFFKPVDLWVAPVSAWLQSKR
jgi:predicted esterase